jgi:hypothetical protein
MRVRKVFRNGVLKSIHKEHIVGGRLKNGEYIEEYGKSEVIEYVENKEQLVFDFMHDYSQISAVEVYEDTWIEEEQEKESK